MEAIHIDRARLESAGVLCPEGGRHGAAEDFRQLKRFLLRAGARARRPCILVTSAMPREGKTFCALNLAMSIALEADHTVLLVDADIARPRVLSTLGLADRPGLTDVLLDGPALLPDVLLRTSIPRLSVLPAGRPCPQSAELLASQAMGRLLDDIGTRYRDRVVVFDSPPLLQASEAGELACRAGQVLLVVEAHRTPRSAVAEALRRLAAHEDVSIVCNRSGAGPGAGAAPAT
jgi:exopolysaccharide/PEP-CTERM locus tyrosine autokinase